jgi:hypothetical protein
MSGRLPAWFAERLGVSVPSTADGAAWRLDSAWNWAPWATLLLVIIAFLMLATVVYFFVVLPMNTLMARLKRGEVAPDPTTKKCPECLSEIPIGARRCAFCTSVISK